MAHFLDGNWHIISVDSRFPFSLVPRALISFQCPILSHCLAPACLQCIMAKPAQGIKFTLNSNVLPFKRQNLLESDQKLLTRPAALLAISTLWQWKDPRPKKVWDLQINLWRCNKPLGPGLPATAHSGVPQARVDSKLE